MHARSGRVSNRNKKAEFDNFASLILDMHLNCAKARMHYSTAG